MYSITDPGHTVRSRPCYGPWFPNMLPIAKECCAQQFADIQLRNLCSFCCYPQDVNLSINLQRAASFGWHLISNKDQTAISPPEISASQHGCSTWAWGISKPSITLVKHLTALRWHHVFIAHKQVILGWIGTMVCVIKNTTRTAQCRLCFWALSIQTRSLPRSWSMRVTESFTRMNGDISREMLRKNNTPYCEVVGILISFQIAHGGFSEEGLRVGVTSQSAKGLDLWHWTRPWGKTRDRWLPQQRNKALRNCCRMHNDDLLPPHVPNYISFM